MFVKNFHLDFKHVLFKKVYQKLKNEFIKGQKEFTIKQRKEREACYGLEGVSLILINYRDFH
jgi:hypothetical protein